MKFSEFCDSIENTEQEQQFLQYVKEEYRETKEAIEDENSAAAIKRIPFVGKMVFALAALADCESLAEFRESEYYPVLVDDWDASYDPDTGKFSLGASAKVKKQAAKIFFVVVGIIAVLLIFCKIRRRKKAV